MEELLALLRKAHDVKALIAYGGLGMICAIVFAETGLLAGFFLPGDSLLVTAGIFAKTGHLSLPALLAALPVCAVLGDQVGYMIGYKAGEALYRRPDSAFFKRAHLKRAHDFYQKYGAKTIVLARFVPIVRTFAPTVAGAAMMDYKTFVTYNVAGGFLWTYSTVLGGYYLASLVPDIEQRIHQVIVAVVFLSVLPVFYELWQHRREAAGRA